MRGLRHSPAEHRRVARRPTSRNDIFPLRVDEKIDIELFCARGRIARERDAGAGIAARIAEDHGLDRDRGPLQALKRVQPPVFLRPRAVPRLVDCLGGLGDLVHRVFGRRMPEPRREIEKLLREPLERLGIELRLVGDALCVDHFSSELGKPAGWRAGDHLREHLDELPVAVEGHARIAGHANEAVHARRVHADVEDGVEHAGHRLFRAGAHGHQQWRAGVAEAALGRCLEPPDAGEDPIAHRFERARRPRR